MFPSSLIVGGGVVDDLLIADGRGWHYARGRCVNIIGSGAIVGLRCAHSVFLVFCHEGLLYRRLLFKYLIQLLLLVLPLSLLPPFKTLRIIIWHHSRHILVVFQFSFRVVVRGGPAKVREG
jgi:hypothetical protein